MGSRIYCPVAHIRIQIGEVHMDIKPYSVTISHQLGSGGAYLGEKLAGRLGIPFLDRDILEEVARQLNLAGKTLPVWRF